jgi:hypothetical protein
VDDSEPKSSDSARIDEIDPHAGDVDITLLQFMLSMTPQQRLEYSDAMRRSLLELRRAGRKHYRITGYDDLDPQSSPSPEEPGR